MSVFREDLPDHPGQVVHECADRQSRACLLHPVQGFAQWMGMGQERADEQPGLCRHNLPHQVPALVGGNEIVKAAVNQEHRTTDPSRGRPRIELLKQRWGQVSLNFASQFGI